MTTPQSHERPSLLAAALTSVGLSTLFLIVYGGCNWFTAQRSNVGTCYFEWERQLPFIPWLIIPYMSIDLFFVAAPFICRNNLELRILVRRIFMAVGIAGIFFLALPLRFAFERPHTDGWLGMLFDAFRTLDQPYNLFPSLHIAQGVVLLDVYSRYFRGGARALTQIWFVLIGVSTVLTYQHHILDVFGGLALGVLCCYVFHESAVRLPVVRNDRIGSYYALAAVATLIGVILAWPWGILLLWPAAALGVVATAYWGLGPGIFRKTAGKLPWGTWGVLGPVLAGQYLSLAYYRRKCQAWDEVVPGVWVGRTLNDREAAQLVSRGVTAVLDLTVEFSEASPFLAVNYRSLPVMDLTAPTRDQMRAAAQFIAEESARGTVYVHCKAGYSRSSATVGAYLLRTGQAGSVEETVAALRSARPGIVIRPEVLAALADFAQDTGVGREEVTNRSCAAERVEAGA